MAKLIENQDDPAFSLEIKWVMKVTLGSKFCFERNQISLWLQSVFLKSSQIQIKYKINGIFLSFFLHTFIKTVGAQFIAPGLKGVINHAPTFDERIRMAAIKNSKEILRGELKQ